MAFFTGANIALIGAILGLLMVILGAIEFYKSRESKKKWTKIGIILLVIGGLIYVSAYLGWIPTLNQPLAAGPTVTTTETGAPTVTPPSGFCAVEDTTVTLSAEDPYTAVAVGGYHRYSINGAPAKVIADAGTFTASPGDILNILWMNASLASNFGKVDTLTVPCSGTKTFSTSIANNGTLTWSAWNEEGLLIDTAGSNETLAAGDVITLTAELKGQYQKDFTHGLTLVVEYNKSAIDKIVIANSNGVELGSGIVLQTDAPTLGADSTRIAYLVPPVISNVKWEGTITIDADDTYDPDDCGSNDLGGDILLRFYGNNYYIDEDEAGAFTGPAGEDEDSALTRTGYYANAIEID